MYNFNKGRRLYKKLEIPCIVLGICNFEYVSLHFFTYITSYKGNAGSQLLPVSVLLVMHGVRRAGVPAYHGGASHRPDHKCLRTNQVLH